MKGVKLGKKIKQMRIDKDFQQGDLAELFEMKNHQQVSKWENGKLFPSVDQLVILSDKLGTNLFEILVDSYIEYFNSDDPRKKFQLALKKAGESKPRFPRERDRTSDGKSKVLNRPHGLDSKNVKGKLNKGQDKH